MDRLPLDFDPVSNGEFVPLPKSRAERAMERVARELVDEGARRGGVTRREVLVGACGTAACLAAIDRVAASPAGRYALPPEAWVDPQAAERALGGDDFVLDVQVHHVLPGGDWEEQNPLMRGLLASFPGGSDYGRRALVKEVFLDSDTTCAVLSAVPATPEAQPLPTDEAVVTRDLVNALGGQRLKVHALVTPNEGPRERVLAGMEAVQERHAISAWKVYTLFGADGRGFWMDDEEVAVPMIEKARAIGPRIFCMHKGIPLPGLANEFHRCRDVGAVAKRFPDVKFLVYHSGYVPGRPEGPYDPEAEDGVDGLIRSLEEHGIEPGSNVYAELGATWWMLMRRPTDAAHVLGKLLKHVGEDNVLWGTDSIWFGSPQPQIAALRAFEISAELCAEHGYPALTRERKRKILGLNAAPLYGFDPAADLPAIRADAVESMKNAYLPRRAPSHRTYGPRTRRELFRLLAERGGRPA